MLRTLSPPRQNPLVGPGKPIKLIVWDLDDTIWHGVLLEQGAAALRPGIIDTIRKLDSRGILHSIASRNDEAMAMHKLKEFGLAEYFLCPQIGWQSKSDSVKIIAEKLRLGLNATLFVDDQQFERAEVSTTLPDVRTFDSAFAAHLTEDPLLTPAIVSEVARRRRLSYREEEARAGYERDFKGVSEEFLESLSLRLVVARATRDDLSRAEELILRTNQLNSTGVTYSFDELESMSHSPGHLVLLGTLSDRFGDYGQIGLMLLKTDATVWRLKLLLVSCRVLSRGVGAVLLNYIMARARTAGVEFEADFRSTGVNRLMQITYRLANFKELRKEGDITVYTHDLSNVPPMPAYFQFDDESAG